MQIQTEHQQLQRACQEKIHHNLKKTVRCLILHIGIQDKSNAKQDTDDHDADTEPVQLMLHIISKPPDGILDFPVYKICHQQNQQTTRSNIRPHIPVKKQDRDLDAANQEYRKQVKSQRKLIYRHIDRIPAHKKCKNGKTDVHCKRHDANARFQVDHIPGAGDRDQNHTKAHIPSHHLPAAIPRLTEQGEQQYRPCQTQRKPNKRYIYRTS